VSNPPALFGEGLDRDQAMRRFHVRKEKGGLVSGATTFVEIWKQLPGWRWAARAAAIPGMLAFLETGYGLFLAARPYLPRLFAISSLIFEAPGSPGQRLVPRRQERAKRNLGRAHEAACYRSKPGHWA
jgi:predicted DCC family thiol-disulfide oxidoreductase YuxK